jgi:hypothetical protein
MPGEQGQERAGVGEVLVGHHLVVQHHPDRPRLPRHLRQQLAPAGAVHGHLPALGEPVHRHRKLHQAGDPRHARGQVTGQHGDAEVAEHLGRPGRAPVPRWGEDRRQVTQLRAEQLPARSDVVGLLRRRAADTELALAALRLVVDVCVAVLVHGDVVPTM